MRNLRILFLFLALILPSIGATISARFWEPIRTERNDVKPILRDNEIEIKASRGVIQISLNRQMTVKVFSILGRQICTETVPPGTSQLIIKSHGVYIVKVGDLTAKVAV